MIGDKRKSILYFVSHVRFLGPLAGAVLWGSAAIASENGNSQYPIGVDTVVTAAVPPPGQGVLLSYNLAYSANIYSGSQKVKGSDVNVYVSAFRGIYTWPTTFDDGKITLSSEIVGGFGYVRVKVPTPVGPLANHSTGLVDPALWPIAVNYHNGPLSISASTVIYFPLGTYHKTSEPSKGLGDNHYSVAPTLYVTYNPSKRLELDFTTTTAFNTVNPNTHYRSGDNESITAAVSYKLTPRFMIGPTVYYEKQFTDDRQFGLAVPGGNRDRDLGLGIEAFRAIGHGGIALKYFHETDVRNQAGGDRFWLEYAIPL